MTDARTETLVRELGALVSRQVAQLRELETVLRAQQAAVAARDVDSILATLADQTQRLDVLRRSDEERTQVLALLGTALGLPTGKLTLRQLGAALGGPLGEELETLSTDGKEALAIVGRVNADNRRMIQDSLDFVESMLAAHAGRAPAKPTYQESGVLARAQIDTIVDHSA